MAKKAKAPVEKVSKADLVRQYLNKHPDEGVAAVVAAITESHGEDNAPKPSQVSAIKKAMADGKIPGKRGRPTGSTNTAKPKTATAAKRKTVKSSAINGSASVSKSLVALVNEEYGGDIEAAQTALSELAELQVG